MSDFKVWKLISLLCVMCLMLGCESKEERTQQTITYTLQDASRAINTLGDALDKKQVRNANLLTEYGNVLSQQNPQLSNIAQLVAQDATSAGPLYQNLLTRYQALKSPQPGMSSDDIIEQAVLLKEAASVSLFNDALTDPINVLADMSNGTLAGSVLSVSLQSWLPIMVSKQWVTNWLATPIMVSGRPAPMAPAFGCGMACTECSVIWWETWNIAAGVSVENIATTVIMGVNDTPVIRATSARIPLSSVPDSLISARVSSSLAPMQKENRALLVSVVPVTPPHQYREAATREQNRDQAQFAIVQTGPLAALAGASSASDSGVNTCINLTD